MLSLQPHMRRKVGSALSPPAGSILKKNCSYNPPSDLMKNAPTIRIGGRAGGVTIDENHVLTEPPLVDERKKQPGAGGLRIHRRPASANGEFTGSKIPLL